MAYCKDVWKFQYSNEVEYKYKGKYGAKGQKRAKKVKATPEQIRKQNQRNREKRIRRLIKANFRPEDLWCTLKYPAGTRKPLGEVMKDLRKFHAAMRKEYKKIGELYKFIYRVEIGKRGGVHIHILINRTRAKPADILISNCWKQGRVNFENIYEAGGYKDLAEYITKLPDGEVQEQMNLFGDEDRKILIKYSSSRNLIRPEPERTEYKRRTMRKIIEEGPKPTKGYYIDKDSIYCGVNRYTGMSYLQYTEVLINQKQEGDEDG